MLGRDESAALLAADESFIVGGSEVLTNAISAVFHHSAVEGPLTGFSHEVFLSCFQSLIKREKKLSGTCVICCVGGYL